MSQWKSAESQLRFECCSRRYSKFGLLYPSQQQQRGRFDKYTEEKYQQSRVSLQLILKRFFYMNLNNDCIQIYYVLFNIVNDMKTCFPE